MCRALLFFLVCGTAGVRYISAVCSSSCVLVPLVCIIVYIVATAHPFSFCCTITLWGAMHDCPPLARWGVKQMVAKNKSWQACRTPLTQRRHILWRTTNHESDGGYYRCLLNAFGGREPRARAYYRVNIYPYITAYIPVHASYRHICLYACMHLSKYFEYMFISTAVAPAENTHRMLFTLGLEK